MADDSDKAGLTYLSATDFIDATPSAERIDQVLGGLEAKAKTEGQAIGIADALPISLQRLAAWAGGLEDRGFVLVPASALLLERDSSNADADQASNLAQSQNE